MPWGRIALEDLDDGHAAAAAWASRLAAIGGIFGGLALRLWGGERLAGMRDVIGACGFGEQAVVADAMEALGQKDARPALQSTAAAL